MTCSLPERSSVPITTVPALPAGRSAPGAHTLAGLTTMGVGGPVRRVVEAHSELDLIAAVREADSSGTPVLVLGGGSNVLGCDASWDGVVVRDMRSQITVTQEGGCEGANVRVAGGTPWDQLVVHAIENEWSGIEALSGIPGTVGAAPVQNIGAYGQEVSGVIARVHTWDRELSERHEFALSELNFGYRSSILKASMRHGWGPSPRYIVLSVDCQFRIASLSEPVRYGQLAKALGVEIGVRLPSTDVRSAVIDLRRSKGMVLDDTDRDTYSCGSFFTNPVLSEAEAARLPVDAPRYPVVDHTRGTLNRAAPVVEQAVKTSAAWLIEHAGFPAGFGMPGPAAVSSKHCLAVTNRGGATGADIRALARTIRQGVNEAFGVVLEPEPIVLGGLDGE